MLKISKKLIRDYKKLKLNKIINLSEVNLAKERLSEMTSKFKNLNGSHNDPSHKIYLLIQNWLSYFSEEVSIHKELEEFYNKMEELEDEFMPSFPPESPLTGSYFTYWAFCDFEFGRRRETISTIFYDLGVEFKFDELILKTLDNLTNSYMGFYRQTGFDGDLIILEDILTGARFETICTSGYRGKKNEIWYARLVENLDEVYNYHIVLTTPYVVVNYKEKDWNSFFQRQKIAKGEDNFEIKYCNFMKHHNDYKYWHNYIMDGYVNFIPTCVFLTGIPDLKGTKPHEINEED